MYNRYIPQPDGSYRRSRMQEPNRPTPKPPQPKPPVCPPQEPVCCEQKQEAPAKPAPHHHEKNVGGFLRQLLPKDFDTGDLIVVLLLLLMAGDCEEDRSNALLTLALYFLM